MTFAQRRGIKPQPRGGLRAATALPIRFHGEVCGVLAVYTDEPHVFQDKEVALLEETAAAVSFALESLNREAKRRRAEEALKEAHDYTNNIIKSMFAMLVVLSPGMAPSPRSTRQPVICWAIQNAI